MVVGILTCITCNDIFRSRYDLNNHVRRDHQSSVKVKFGNGDIVEVKRAGDNTFKCRCKKSFKLPDSLRRHVKNCRSELAEQTEGESMSVYDSDFDASESVEFNEDRVDDTPIDCFGALIFCEIG